MHVRRPWYTVLYLQVLIAIAAGVLVGHFFPVTGAALKPLGDGFIQLIKMMIAPVIFCTIVHGIATMGDLKKVGRVGIKTLVYFEVISTIALIIGLIVGELAQPGSGFNIDASKLETELGWKARMSFESGIRATVQWYLDNEWWWGPLRAGVYSGERLGMLARG